MMGEHHGRQVGVAASLGEADAVQAAPRAHRPAYRARTRWSCEDDRDTVIAARCGGFNRGDQGTRQQTAGVSDVKANWMARTNRRDATATSAPDVADEFETGAVRLVLRESRARQDARQ